MILNNYLYCLKSKQMSCYFYLGDLRIAHANFFNINKTMLRPPINVTITRLFAVYTTFSSVSFSQSCKVLRFSLSHGDFGKLFVFNSL